MPGDAREIYQEGLIIPPVKAFERGQESAAVFRMLLANVRSPESLYGDVRAMCGSLITADRLLQELAGRIGWEKLTRYGAELKNYAERRFRAELAKLPRGIHRGKAVIDDDGVGQNHFTVELAVAISDAGVVADFRGSSAQARGPINCTYSVTCAATLNAILHLIGQDLPINEGVHRAIHVIAPPKTIVNVDHPGAYNAGQTETHNLLVEAFMDALLEAAPERVCAQSANTTCLVTGGAWHPLKGETYTFITWDGAGWGAFNDQDGNSGASRYCGTVGKNYPTEVLETQFPWLIKSFEFRTDSAGPGEHRGGLGLVRDYELRAPDLEFGVNSNRGRFAPAGVKGGGDGKPTRYWVRRNGALVEPMQIGSGINSPDKFSGVRLTEGEGLVVETPGGGGWGDPKSRDRGAVEEDLKQGYISRKAAVEVYGLDARRADEIVAQYHWRPARRA
jgi:N-methylhydantoinase B/oxoprolinase/acetone carboxylase alpha subunit